MTGSTSSLMQEAPMQQALNQQEALMQVNHQLDESPHGARVRRATRQLHGLHRCNPFGRSASAIIRSSFRMHSELKASKNIDTRATGRELIGIGDADRVQVAERLPILRI